MDNPVWYVSMPCGIVHIGRMSIAVGPVQRLSFDRQVPAFFIPHLLNPESISQGLIGNQLILKYGKQQVAK